MKGLQARRDELLYLGQLERILVKKLRSTDDSDLQFSKPKKQSNLNQVSIEINEELDRLERLIGEENLSDESALVASKNT